MIKGFGEWAAILCGIVALLAVNDYAVVKLAKPTQRVVGFDLASWQMEQMRKYIKGETDKEGYLAAIRNLKVELNALPAEYLVVHREVIPGRADVLFYENGKLILKESEPNVGESAAAAFIEQLEAFKQANGGKLPALPQR